MKNLFILVLLAALRWAAFSQTSLPGVPVSGPIVPLRSDHTYPTLDPTYMLGGWRTITNSGAYTSIPAARLQYGMVVYDQANAAWFTYLTTGWTNLTTQIGRNIANTDLSMTANRTLIGAGYGLTYTNLLMFNVMSPTTLGDYTANNIVLHVDDKVEAGAYPQYANNSGALRTARPITQVTAVWDDGDAYTGTAEPTWETEVEFTDGAVAVIIPDQNNTGASTIDIGGKVHSIVRATGVPLEADDLVASNPSLMVYATGVGWRLMGAAVSGGGSAPSGGVAVYNTITDLVAGPVADVAFARGHTTADDGGGGWFISKPGTGDNVIDYNTAIPDTVWHRVEFDITGIMNVAWAGVFPGVVAQDVPFNLIRTKIAQEPLIDHVRIKFNTGTYYFTNTVDLRAGSTESLEIIGADSERGAFAESQQGVFSGTKLWHAPLASSTNWCWKMGPSDNGGLWGGRVILKNLHFKNQYNGLVVGDPAKNTYGPNGEFNPTGGQRYAHNVKIEDCLFEQAVVAPYTTAALSTAIADSTQLYIVGAYETDISNTVFEGGGTQVKLLTTDQTQIHNCRFLQGHVAIWSDAKAINENFTTSTPTIVHNCEFEAWHIGAVVGHGNVQIQGGGMERNSASFAAAAGEGYTALQASVSVSVTNQVTFSASQADNLRPWLSLLVLTNTTTGNILFGSVKSVATTTVTLDERNISIPTGTYNIGRVHGYAVYSTMASGFVQSAAVSQVRYSGYSTVPSFVWSPGNGNMFLNSVTSDNAYGSAYFPSIVVGNRLSTYSTGQNTFLYAQACSDQVRPDPQHPLVRSDYRSDLRAWAGFQNDEANKPGNRDPAFGKRTWVYSARGGVHLQSFPAVNYELVTGETNTAQRFWAMRLATNTAAGLLFIDRTLPSDITKAYRIRVWAKPASGTPLLDVGFEGISFVQPISGRSMSGDWASYDYVGQLPTPWGTAAGRTSSTDTSIRVNTTGGEIYLDSVIVEPLDMLCPIPVVYNQTFNSSFTPDVRSGTTIRTTATSDFTLNLPSGMTSADDGLRFILQVKHSGGSYNITFNGSYDLGESLRFYSPSASGKTDLLTFQYNHSASKWICTGMLFGYTL